MPVSIQRYNEAPCADGTVLSSCPCQCQYPNCVLQFFKVLLLEKLDGEPRTSLYHSIQWFMNHDYTKITSLIKVINKSKSGQRYKFHLHAILVMILTIEKQVNIFKVLFT